MSSVARILGASRIRSVWRFVARYVLRHAAIAARSGHDGTEPAKDAAPEGRRPQAWIWESEPVKIDRARGSGLALIWGAEHGYRLRSLWRL